METKDKLIEKLKEFIKHQQRFMISSGDIRADLWESKRKRLESEIAALEKQIEEKKPIEDRSAEITFNDDMDDEEQESKPVYDENYLNECIEKATINLSKIKNVDKYLAEIRGEFESISRIDDPHEGKYYELKFNNPVKSLCLGRDDCLVRWLFWINKKVTPINIYFIGNEIKEINPFCHICEFENKMKE